MSREIKFRAWDGEKIQEVHLLGLHWEAEKDPPIYIDMPNSDEVPHYSDCPLMQYTGLKDKNGVEIFEGDIIQRYEGATPCKVVWYEYGWCYQEGDDDPYPILKAEKVIGNIYENPEMLK